MIQFCNVSSSSVMLVSKSLIIRVISSDNGVTFNNNISIDTLLDSRLIMKRMKRNKRVKNKKSRK